MQFDGPGAEFSCRCVRCGAEREMPEPDRSRWPARDASESVTLKADEPCSCGGERVRITFRF